MAMSFHFSKTEFLYCGIWRRSHPRYDRLNSLSHHPYSHLMGYSGCKRGGCFFICSDVSRWQNYTITQNLVGRPHRDRVLSKWDSDDKSSHTSCHKHSADTPQFMHPHHHHHWLCHWFHAKGTFCEMEHYFNYWYHPLQGAGRTCNWNHCHFHHYYHLWF